MMKRSVTKCSLIAPGGRKMKKLRNITLWWSVNLSHNWVFNVWTVNLIKTLTTINHQVNCNRLLFVVGSLCIVTGWSIYSSPHTRWYSKSWTFYTFLSYQCLSESQNKLANQNLRVYNTQIRPNCRRAS